MANTADPDQLASSEANWSGSTLFAKAEYIRVQQDKGLWDVKTKDFTREIIDGSNNLILGSCAIEAEQVFGHAGLILDQTLQTGANSERVQGLSPTALWLKISFSWEILDKFDKLGTHSLYFSSTSILLSLNVCKIAG